jgi:hypothetical protein
MPTDLRCPVGRLSVHHTSWETVGRPQYQSVDRDEGSAFGTGSPQHIDLLPQDQNFCLKRYSRPQQVHHHSKDQSAQIQHRAAASPNSRSTASRMAFATGTGSNIKAATCARRSVSSPDPGQDRALAPDPEEPHSARQLLPTWRSRAADRRLALYRNRAFDVDLFLIDQARGFV